MNEGIKLCSSLGANVFLSVRTGGFLDSLTAVSVSGAPIIGNID